MNHTCDLDGIDWAQFTGRSAPPIASDAVRATSQGKRILITGAGGSIGSALARRIAQFDPAELILFDLGELGLHQLGCDLGAEARVRQTRLIVGSVSDRSLVSEVFSRFPPEIVFHAAACKHVPLMEANPITAACTNIVGTELILNAASLAGAEQSILLSTDKAVDPVSIMGATKRIAELIVLHHPGPAENKALRLGNVLGSSGSVAPLFRSEIARGGPITVTHPDATRYFRTINEAVDFLLSTLAIDAPSTIFVPSIGTPHRIVDLANFLMAQAPQPSAGIRTVYTGLRPGDKLTESLVSAGEALGPATSSGLHPVQTMSSLPEITGPLAEITAAVRRRDLPSLLQAMQTLVPEFHPGDLLIRHAGSILTADRP